MATITLLDQTYTLPAVTTERFRHLQSQVQEQQRVVQEGIRPQPRLFGLIPRPPQQLSPQERWQELDGLVRNYDAILAELRSSKDAYQAFFAQLASGVQRAVQNKSVTMRKLEKDRLADVQTAQAQHDETLLRLAEEDGTRLLQGARLLGQAALLLLKKIALVQDGLERLVEDQALQQRLLSDLVGRLESHRRAYERRRQIDQVLTEVARMAEVALQFESYMREHFGPLQAMLDRVAQLDNGLHQAVTEIETLTRQMLQQGAVAPPGGDALEQRWLDFLTTSQVKKERMQEMWEHLERQDGAMEALDADIAVSAPVPSVLTALENIDALVEARLGAVAAPEAPKPAVVSLQQRSLVNSIGMTFVWLPAGEFLMGDNHGRDDAKPVHTVRISQPFYLGQYAVTQGQWEAVMGNNPSCFLGEPNRPVEQVSWEDVQQFIHTLQQREPGVTYRLPTEAEWEYAARAGSPGAYCFGDDVTQLQQYAWYAENAAGTTHPVGQLQSNPWGFYDMHGNVWEWVQDWYAADYYKQSAGRTAVDPGGPAAGSYRVIRGGCWGSAAGYCRSAYRRNAAPGDRRHNVGLRVLRTAS